MRERRLKRPSRMMHRSDNEYDQETMPQYIQVSVNVLEARKLAWSNPQAANSYVMVVLGSNKQRTTIRKNMEDPLYREYLVYEMYMSIREVQMSSLWLAVMEPKCCAPPRVLGEATIDLGAIWAQPNHKVYHKWAQLTLPRETDSLGPAGFLKVDISIMFRGEVQVMPALVNDEHIREDLLPTTAEQQRANYLITVHAAFSLPSCVQAQNDRRYGKPPTTYVRVTFCGLVAKTAVQHRTNDPVFSEQISIVEMFPSSNHTINFDVCSGEGNCNRIVAGTELKLGQISHDGENGFLPTFGPSLLHMYAPAGFDDGPHHKGALLVSLKTIVPYYLQNLRTVTVEPVPYIRKESLWVQEDFSILCPIFEVSMLDRRISGSMSGLAITMSEVSSNERGDEEFMEIMLALKSRKLHYTGSLEVVKQTPYSCIEFPHQFPVLQLALRLPDFRFRMYKNNIVQRIVSELEHAITKVEKRLNHYDYTSPNELVDDMNEAVDDAAGNILKYLDIVQYSNDSCHNEESFQQYSTELDQRQYALQREEIEKIYNQIVRKAKGESNINLMQISRCTRDSLVGTRKGVKIMLAKTKVLVQSLKSTIYKSSDGWPDIILWLLNEGSRVAYSKISAADVIFSVIPEQCGKYCGQLQTIYMKPLKCPRHANASPSKCTCIAAKVELIFWMGLFRQRHALESRMPPGYDIKYNDFEMNVKATLMMIECKAYIYRAKLTTIGGVNLNIIYNSFVRINALSAAKQTKPQIKTCTPIWNQVVKIQKMVRTSQDRLNKCPPYVLVEVYDDQITGKNELIGWVQIQPTVDNRLGFAPKLQWYELYKGAQNTGKILMSVQLITVPERLLKTTYYAPFQESFHAAGARDDNEMDLDDFEPLPLSLIPRSNTYKVDIYWWGLRDVNITRKPCVVLELDELVLKSDIICDKKSSCNFPNGRSMQIFESPLNEDYSPTLNIRLYDSSTFGRTLFLATNVVKNPSKYLVDWMPKHERESSLKSVSIMSADFRAVGGQMIYTRKCNKEVYDEFLSNNSSKCQINCQMKAKQSVWRKIFSGRVPADEEMTLLPVYAKENNQIKVVKKFPKPVEFVDWWMRFFQSENVIFDDEKLSSDYITIYDCELEYQPEFSKFKDWCSTLKLYSGKKTGIPEQDEHLHCGYLKAGIAIYRWPPPERTIAVSLNGVELDKGYFDDHPINDPSKYVVRAYVVRALNLSRDCVGKSDPYVMMNCGKKQLGDRNNYVANTSEPIFGKLFEFSCTLPEDYLLNISVYDFDSSPPDELIGSTTIDLEDRIYSKHKARVGLSPEYNISGPAKWRDNMKPSQILEELCVKNHIPSPLFPDSSTVMVNGVKYKDNGRHADRNYVTAAERKENICLNILHNWHTLPICGYHLVPEHVETRSLYHPGKPGFEKGKIQLWLDILPLDANTFIPPPYDITPRKVEDYELRVIVWDVQTTPLVLEKKKYWKTADLYVKVWIGSIDNAQETDVHYNSVSGEGNFNWRMVFNFLYHHANRKLINKEQCPYTEYEEYVTPVLEVQLVESNEDVFLGSLSLDLNSMYRGAKSAQNCTITAMETGKRINLFSLRSIRAWWPLRIIDHADNEVPAGVIDLEMSLLPREKALIMPCGIGRDPPSPLPDPRRPAPLKQGTKWYCYIREVCHSRGKEMLICVVIIAVVWLAAYLVYLAIPAAENFIFQNRRRKKQRNKIEGIIRTLSNFSLRL